MQQLCSVRNVTHVMNMRSQMHEIDNFSIPKQTNCKCKKCGKCETCKTCKQSSTWETYVNKKM